MLLSLCYSSFPDHPPELYILKCRLHISLLGFLTDVFKIQLLIPSTPKLLLKSSYFSTRQLHTSAAQAQNLGITLDTILLTNSVSYTFKIISTSHYLLPATLVQATIISHLDSTNSILIWILFPCFLTIYSPNRNQIRMLPFLKSCNDSPSHSE